MRRLFLVGHPNVGKTTLFNTLTARQEPVGNWPGVTVDVKKGVVHFCEQSLELFDLPGIYTVDTQYRTLGLDEQLAQQVLSEKHWSEQSMIVNVIDACHLERHLFLTLQLLALGRPMMIILNKVDKASRRGIEIDSQALSEALGCPVIFMHDDVRAAMFHDRPEPPSGLEFRCKRDEQAMWQLAAALASKVQQQVQVQQPTITEKIDRMVLHRIWGLPLFFLLIYTVFFFVMHVGGALQHALEDWGSVVLVDGFAEVLRSISAPQWVTTCLAYGVGQGIRVTLSFVPILALLFLCLSWLEASGYMVRAAFVVDRLMQYLKLPGKAFVPMIIGFGCNVPAVMAARTLEVKQDRWMTLMMTPFMSCSARLIIYAVFVAAFFPQRGENIIFSLYLVGFLMAIITGILLKKIVLSGERSPLVMELPDYAFPALKQLLYNTIKRLYRFLLRAGRMIVLVCTVLSVFRGGMLLMHLVKWVTPLLMPMGIAQDQGIVTLSLIMGMLAKEVVIGTLNMSDVPLILHFNGAIGAYAYLLFVSLYIPCVSTMAAIKQESNRRWMWLSVGWSLWVAYSISVLFYQLATLTHHLGYSLFWIWSVIAMNAFIFYCLKRAVSSGFDIENDVLGDEKRLQQCLSFCGACKTKRTMA